MSKIISGLMGLVVADALGVPYEFKERGSFKATGMTGYGTHDMPPGTWSDDSSMTIATVKSIIDNKGKIDLYSIMNNFFDWYYYADFTPHGVVFDVGNTTRKAIHKYRSSGRTVEGCGCDAFEDNGNGSLMRMLPLACILNINVPSIHAVSALTHAHDISKKACEIYVDFALGLMLGFDKNLTLDTVTAFGVPEEFQRLINIKDLTEDDIKSTGFVVDTLEAAIWSFMTTDNYKDCVLKAVNLGGDTDTIAAVAGGLAGIYYGIGGDKGIPYKWIDKTVKHAELLELFERFEKVCK